MAVGTSGGKAVERVGDQLWAPAAVGLAALVVVVGLFAPHLGEVGGGPFLVSALGTVAAVFAVVRDRRQPWRVAAAAAGVLHVIAASLHLYLTAITANVG